MLEHIREFLEIAVTAIEVFAAAVIVFGFFRAMALYPGVRRAEDREAAFSAFRHRLGSDLLLGLEILVVADVIDTILVEPSYQSLAVLAFLVIVRTMISWSVDLQAEGRWPWQPEAEEGPSDA